MPTEIIVCLISLCGTVIGSVVGVMTSTRLTTYRIAELEKKVDKHNSVVERVALLEKDNGTQWKRIDELRADLNEIKKEVYKKGA